MSMFVFLIDDDPATNFYNKHLLTKRFPSAAIRVFEQGEEAARVLRGLSPTERPDLILLDVNLPDLSGWDLLESLPTECLSGTRIVVLSVIPPQPLHLPLLERYDLQFTAKPLCRKFLDTVLQ